MEAQISNKSWTHTKIVCLSNQLCCDAFSLSLLLCIYFTCIKMAHEF